MYFIQNIVGGGVMKSKSGLGAYILIALGIIFLLSNLGWLPHLGPLVAQGWPLILIMVGVFLLMRMKTISFIENEELPGGLLQKSKTSPGGSNGYDICYLSAISDTSKTLGFNIQIFSKKT
jgi:hypothetical protein